MDCMNCKKNDEKVYSVGRFKISHTCLETYPCQHYVKDTELTNDNYKTMWGKDIFTMLKQHGLSLLHFDKYEEPIIEQDTEEIIAARKKERDEILLKEQERMNIERQKQEELNIIVNKYKASSYLERLKMKHSIKVHP